LTIAEIKEPVSNVPTWTDAGPDNKGGFPDEPSLKENLGRVLNQIAEEVSAPVSIIIGNAQIIALESAGLPERLNRHVEAIVDGAKQISLITHKLMNINRLTTGNCPADHDQTVLHIHKSTGEKL
jgi:signal transduction histidine kinase